MLKIAISSNISLGNDNDEINRNIDTIKAKELAQAKLAELRWKQEELKNSNQTLASTAEHQSAPTEVILDKNDVIEEGLNTPELKKRGGSKSKKKKMRCLFWNVRGLGNKARRRQLKVVIKERDVDLLCVQETKKESFTNKELNSFQGDKSFSRSWKAARGASGGILIGINSELMEVLENHVGAFFLSCLVKTKCDNFCWEFIGVYGPVNDSLKPVFLDDLRWHIQFRQHPYIIGGDLNMYRFASEKSNTNLDTRAMGLFNSFISYFDLRDLYRSGPRFTWTNKQDTPT